MSKCDIGYIKNRLAKQNKMETHEMKTNLNFQETKNELENKYLGIFYNQNANFDSRKNETQNYHQKATKTNPNRKWFEKWKIHKREKLLFRELSKLYTTENQKQKSFKTKSHMNS